MKEFATKDLHLAAYLKLKGVELLRIENRSEEKFPMYFIFNNSGSVCEALDKKFWDDGDLIDIRDFISTIRYLRERIHRLRDSHATNTSEYYQKPFENM